MSGQSLRQNAAHVARKPSASDVSHGFDLVQHREEGRGIDASGRQEGLTCKEQMLSLHGKRGPLKMHKKLGTVHSDDRVRYMEILTAAVGMQIGRNKHE